MEEADISDRVIGRGDLKMLGESMRNAGYAAEITDARERATYKAVKCGLRAALASGFDYGFRRGLLCVVPDKHTVCSLDEEIAESSYTDAIEAVLIRSGGLLASMVHTNTKDRERMCTGN